MAQLCAASHYWKTARVQELRARPQLHSCTATSARVAGPTTVAVGHHQSEEEMAGNMTERMFGVEGGARTGVGMSETCRRSSQGRAGQSQPRDRRCHRGPVLVGAASSQAQLPSEVAPGPQKSLSKFESDKRARGEIARWRTGLGAFKHTTLSFSHNIASTRTDSRTSREVIL